MPDSGTPVTVIREGTFYGTRIKSIRIPSSVTRIEDTAFSSCEDLASVEFNQSQRISFGKRVFSGCKNLTFFQFPDNFCGDIEESLFAGCRMLNNIKFGAAYAYINTRALVNIGLQDIVIPRNITPTKNSFGGQWLRKIIFEGRTTAEVKAFLDKGFIAEGYRPSECTIDLVCTDGVITYKEPKRSKSSNFGWI